VCGIVGISGFTRDKLDVLSRRMSAALRHRGPDSDGHWINQDSTLALGHRRLSIIDLSAEGHQPMTSGSGRFSITFNGEIYNFGSIREELIKLGTHFRGTSDTEVMLAAFETWGIDTAIRKFAGMFAFGVWDAQEHALTIARDRLGEKPLYYCWHQSGFAFASELKALSAAQLHNKEICLDAVYNYSRNNCIPAPLSIYKGVWKLPPGCTLTVPLSYLKKSPSYFSPHPANDATDGFALENSRTISPIRYWSALNVALRDKENSYARAEDAVEDLDRLLRTVIKEQMISDVPLGAFLSGGVDSSAIVAIMQQVSSHPVKTFSIGFWEKSYNEAHHAKQVAQYLNTDHTELYATAQDALDVIPLLPSLYDEPFADSSQIPTYLVAKLARAHVTVSLSGDGGDELFGGYSRYFSGSSLRSTLQYSPAPLRELCAHLINRLSPRSWDRMLKLPMRLLPDSYRLRNIGDKFHKLAQVLQSKSGADFYVNLLTQWEDSDQLLVNPPLHSVAPSQISTIQEEILSFRELMMFLDLTAYLPDDILVKVDRATMGVSLESRAPFIDHRVAEFAWGLPIDYKMNGNISKWILRQVLYRYVPQKLLDRPKMGFGLPIDVWLRRELRDWAEDLLNVSTITQQGIFNPAPIQKMWREHLKGDRNWQFKLWDILMFQAWYKNSHSM